MRFRLPALLLLASLFAAGCGNSGPKQTLVFKATRLPGATGSIEPVATKLVVQARVTGANTGKPFVVNVTPTDEVEVSVVGASERNLERIKAFVTLARSVEFAAVAHTEEDRDIATKAQEVE